MLPEGFYIGNWNSSISWLSDSNSNVSAPIEMDFYGGYKTEIVKDVPIDVGVLQYYYPGSYPDGFTRPHTTEGYAQRSATARSRSSIRTRFRTCSARPIRITASTSICLGSFDTGFWGLTLNLHAGYQQVPHQAVRASYADWKVGVTKDFGNGWGGVAGLYRYGNACAPSTRTRAATTWARPRPCCRSPRLSNNDARQCSGAADREEPA
ncbi:TorF family putative porin [Cupriavidus basilensis]